MPNCSSYQLAKISNTRPGRGRCLSRDLEKWQTKTWITSPFHGTITIMKIRNLVSKIRLGVRGNLVSCSGFLPMKLLFFVVFFSSFFLIQPCICMTKAADATYRNRKSSWIKAMMSLWGNGGLETWLRLVRPSLVSGPVCAPHDSKESHLFHENVPNALTAWSREILLLIICHSPKNCLNWINPIKCKFTSR